MPIAVAVWSCAVKPGKAELVQPAADLRITNVALSAELENEKEKARTSLKFTYNKPISMDDSEEEEEVTSAEQLTVSTVLCSLTPSKIEHAMIDLILEEGEDYLFETVGDNTLYLTGNYIDQMPADQPPYGSDEDDSDEDGYDLRDVSSDVEMNPEDLIGGDDEDDGAASKKRPRDSDAEAAVSKAQKKKQKKANGEAVAAGADTPAPKEAKKDKAEKKEKGEKKEKEKKKGDTKVLDGGVKITDAKVGTGKQAKAGMTVGMRYIGKLDNGSVFDKNTAGKPFTFKLGDGDVIKGWDVGIVGMQVGGERELVIPPAMGYGKRKMTGIPAGSTLTFEVKLLSIN